MAVSSAIGAVAGAVLGYRRAVRSRRSQSAAVLLPTVSDPGPWDDNSHGVEMASSMLSSSVEVTFANSAGSSAIPQQHLIRLNNPLTYQSVSDQQGPRDDSLVEASPTPSASSRPESNPTAGLDRIEFAVIMLLGVFGGVAGGRCVCQVACDSMLIMRATLWENKAPLVKRRIVVSSSQLNGKSRAPVRVML